MPELDERPRRRNSLSDLLAGGPAGFRERLERLGPTFIKMGQFLALRPDILRQEYCDELMKLLDRVPSFPWPQAQAALARHFGKDPSEVFEYIDPRPVAAGSLAQIHFARLPGGEEVAVKVLRPHIHRRVRRDLRRAALMARVLKWGRVSLFASPEDLLRELSVWMTQEIDLVHELANLTRLYELARNDSSQKIPRPYPELSGPEVLVTEFLRGIPLSDVLASKRDRARVEDLGVDWNRFASNLIHATLTQIFRYHFFHADLHPGNLLVLPGDVIGYVDFGLCARVDETVRREQMRYLSAVYDEDVEQMFNALTEVLVRGPNADEERFRMDFLAEARRWLSELENDGISSGDERSPAAHWMIGVMRAARRNGFQIPTGILAMYRSLLTAETVATTISADADLQGAGRDFFRRYAWEDVIRSVQPAQLEEFALTIASLLKDSPAQLHRVITDMAEGHFTVNTNASEDPRLEQARNRRARLLTASILTIGVAMLAGSSSLPQPFGIPLSKVLYAILGILYAVIIFQWRKLR